ncbi:MAG: hypothetical protein J5556_07090 [Deltaproteobacteria bacterium]|nr:hypothetical protein [Deltaproteobacteria bacterium]
MAEEKLYKMREIAEATGIKHGTLESRRRKQGIPGNDKGYTLDQVKRMIKRPQNHRQFSMKKAMELRQILKNDGAIPF